MFLVAGAESLRSDGGGLLAFWLLILIPSLATTAFAGGNSAPTSQTRHWLARLIDDVISVEGSVDFYPVLKVFLLVIVQRHGSQLEQHYGLLPAPRCRDQVPRGFQHMTRNSR